MTMMILNERNGRYKFIDMMTTATHDLVKTCEFYCNHDVFTIMYSNDNRSWYE